MSYLGTNRGRARLSLEPVSDVPPKIQSGLAAYWSMRRSGATVYDEFGQSNGTAVDTPTFDARRGVTLNGSSQYISLTGHSALNVGAGNFTLNLWTIPLMTSDAEYMLFIRGKRYAGGKRYFLSVKHSASALALASGIDDDVTNIVLENAADTFAPGTVQMATLIRNSGNLYLYRNAAQIATTSVAAVGSLDNATDFGAIGVAPDASGDPTELFYNGSITSVGLWKRALSTDELAELYAADLKF
jgi:hypothetical protein